MLSLEYAQGSCLEDDDLLHFYLRHFLTYIKFCCNAIRELYQKIKVWQHWSSRQKIKSSD